MDSEVYADPVTELMVAPLGDCIAALLLAPEQQALKITNKPVWITGVGWNQETYYLGDRDLSRSNSMELASKMAYDAAGITDPKSEIDLAEIHTQYAHEELILSEALGLADNGKGNLLTDKNCINPSGGALGGNSPCATGLIRVIEAVKQLRGEAGEYQIIDAKKAVATGQIGMCAQSNIVWVLEKGGA